MSYRAASYSYTRHYSAKSYSAGVSSGDIDLLIIKIAVISIIFLLFILTTITLNNLYNKNLQEIYAQKEQQNTLINQYKALTDEKNNFFSQKLHNEYSKKLGLHPPKENQTIRLRD
jgi:ABC-type bacteriocin/lantibiotic exporter with double-glycine peptidase domain